LIPPTLAQDDDQDLEDAYCGYIEPETTEKECSICMEQFEKDDIVSWSPTTTCLHVFHHECIKEWLLYHDNCPYCRVTVLPVDMLTTENPRSADTSFSLPFGGANNNRLKNENLMKLARDRAQRVRTTYYCLEDGLVVLPRTPLSTSKEAQKTFRRFLSTRVKATSLVALRDSRTAKSDSDGGPGIVTVPSTSTASGSDNGNVPFAREVGPLRIVSS
jgi:Ring finger domain